MSNDTEREAFLTVLREIHKRLGHLHSLLFAEAPSQASLLMYTSVESIARLIEILESEKEGAEPAEPSKFAKAG